MNDNILKYVEPSKYIIYYKIKQYKSCDEWIFYAMHVCVQF